MIWFPLRLSIIAISPTGTDIYWIYRVVLPVSYGVSLDARLELIYKYSYSTNVRIGVSEGAGYCLHSRLSLT